MVRLTKARTEPGDYLVVGISSRLSILNSKRILSYGPFDNPMAEMFLIRGPCSALTATPAVRNSTSPQIHGDPPHTTPLSVNPSYSFSQNYSNRQNIPLGPSAHTIKPFPPPPPKILSPQSSHCLFTGPPTPSQYIAFSSSVPHDSKL